MIEVLSTYVLPFLKENGVSIAVIFLLFLGGKVVLSRIVHRTMNVVSVTKGFEHDERAQKRARTLAHVILAVGNTLIYAIAILMILNLLNISVAPLLTGAGILGLAVGFGTQALVKDFVSGLFILIENQYGVGDKVKIGTSEGEVLKITIRSTVLRDAEGKISYIPNGTITNVVNLSQTEEQTVEETPVAIEKK